MKLFFIIGFSLLPVFGMTQQTIVGNVKLKVKTPFKPAVITLIGDHYQSDYDFKGSFSAITIKGLRPGYFKLQINKDEPTLTLKDCILIKQNQDLILHFFSDSCLYNYPKGYIPKCPHNHFNNIIPIWYGLIARLIPKKGKVAVTYPK